MMKNSFQAFCNKEFKNNKLEPRLDFDLQEELDTFFYPRMMMDKKIFVCPHFCKVKLKLTNWANGYVLLKYDLKENKKILKKVIDGIEAFTGNRRINEFVFLFRHIYAIKSQHDIGQTRVGRERLKNCF